jgi:hypothetical protein
MWENIIGMVDDIVYEINLNLYKTAEYLSPSMQFVENENVNCTILLMKGCH